VSFCFRIRFELAPRVRIQCEETSILLTTTGASEQVRLLSTEEGAAIKTVTGLVVRGQTYDSADDASDAAARWRGVLQKALARLHVQANFGDRTGSRGFWFRPALKMMEEATGQRVLNDVLGTMVFECEPAPVFVSTPGASVHVGVQVDRFNKAIAAANNLGAVISHRDQLAYDLFSAAAWETSADARLVTLLMAIETLIEPQPRPEAVRAHVDRLIADTRIAGLPEPETTSIVGSLSWLREESIGQAGRRLADRLGDRMYMERTPRRFFTDCYALRSALVHGTYPRPSREEVEQHAGPLSLFVRDLLSLELLTAIPE
jgi:hypothetical protein